MLRQVLKGLFHVLVMGVGLTGICCVGFALILAGCNELESAQRALLAGMVLSAAAGRYFARSEV